MNQEITPLMLLLILIDLHDIVITFISRLRTSGTSRLLVRQTDASAIEASQIGRHHPWLKKMQELAAEI